MGSLKESFSFYKFRSTRSSSVGNRGTEIKEIVVNNERTVAETEARVTVIGFLHV